MKSRPFLIGVLLTVIAATTVLAVQNYDEGLTITLVTESTDSAPGYDDWSEFLVWVDYEDLDDGPPFGLQQYTVSVTIHALDACDNVIATTVLDDNGGNAPIIQTDANGDYYSVFTWQNGGPFQTITENCSLYYMSVKLLKSGVVVAEDEWEG